jgi:hypothetical protein
VGEREGGERWWAGVGRKMAGPALGWVGFVLFFFLFSFFQILFQTNIFNTFKFKSFTQLSPTFPQLF